MMHNRALTSHCAVNGPTAMQTCPAVTHEKLLPESGVTLVSGVNSASF